jgi:hypothetical protein
VVEGALSRTPSRRRREGGAEDEESGFDLSPGALGAIGGALARNPGPLQPVGFLPQALGPLEEGRVLVSVLPDGGGRPRDQGRVRRGLLLPAQTTEETAEYTPGSARKGTYPERP